MDLVAMLTEKLGISSDQAEQGAGLIFAKAKEHLEGPDFEKIKGAVPDMDSLLGKAPDAEPSEAGGLMGMVGGAAEKFGLGNIGAMAEMTAGLGKLGIDADKLPTMVSTILEFVESKVGVDAKAIVEKFLKP